MLSILLIILVFISLFFMLFVKEPVYAVFCFILIICSLVGLLFLLNVEYIALMFLLIYIGAIVVLFLFITMLLNLRVKAFTRGIAGEGVLSWQVGLVLLVGLLVLLKVLLYVSIDFSLETGVFVNNIITIKDPAILLLNSNLINIFSMWLYNFYAPILIICSFILLIALVGSILLTTL